MTTTRRGNSTTRQQHHPESVPRSNSCSNAWQQQQADTASYGDSDFSTTRQQHQVETAPCGSSNTRLQQRPDSAPRGCSNKLFQDAPSYAIAAILHLARYPASFYRSNKRHRVSTMHSNSDYRQFISRSEPRLLRFFFAFSLSEIVSHPFFRLSLNASLAFL